ncbi:MAG: glucuronate isomerase [Candidatus Latescibacterota bacterium]
MRSDTLRKHLWQAIEPMWAVDFHSHIPVGQESAASMARLLCYHYSETDAMNAGMPYQDYIAQEGWEAKARFLVPYFPLSIGTTTYAGLHEVARGLFGFEQRITADTWEALSDRANARMREAGWLGTALKASRIAHVFGTNDPFEPLSGAQNWYQPCLRVDKFINIEEHALSTTVANLGQTLGGDITTLSDFTSAIDARFRWFREQGAVSIAVSLPPDFSLGCGTESPEAVFGRMVMGHPVCTADLHALRTRFFYTALGLCRKYGFVFQLMLGVVRQVHRGVGTCGDGLIGHPDMFRAFWEPLNTYPDVRFDFTVLSAADQHPLCILVKNFPNAVVSGMWWYCNTPSIIERTLRMRLELVGFSCQNGQNTDAYMIEQSYYKMRQYKRALVQTFGTMIEDGFFTEEEGIGIAHALLFDNPIRLFGLNREKIAENIRDLESG